MISVKMLRLLTFGGLALQSTDGSPVPRVRPQRLAILAVLASAGERGVSRERMAGLFWPDSDDEHARHALRQALYALRQELGGDVIRSGTVLALDRDRLTSDVGAFREALAAGDGARAIGCATGTFLDGFYLVGAPEFERWVEAEREVLGAEATKVALSLARAADAAGDVEAAAEWWRQLTVLDPLSGRFALGYLRALASRGDRAGALAFARAHASLVRRELEADADPEIHRLVVELRAKSAPTAAAVAASSTATGSTAPGTSVTGAGEAAAAARAEVRALLGLRPTEPDAMPAEATRRVARALTMLPAARRRRWRVAVAGAVLLLLVVAGMASRGRLAFGFGAAPRSPVLAVGMIREDGPTETRHADRVLTDMLATNLSRVAGLDVLSNWRLFELMRPGQDTLVAGFTDAARRAGATEILQGRLVTGSPLGMTIEVQRVDLATGLVKGGYRASAADQYALIDSVTAVIARDLRLGSPDGSVADATTSSLLAYRFYEEGVRAFYQADASAAERLLRAALREDSNFVMAAYYLTRVVQADDALPARARALQLASRAPERERLAITAELLDGNDEPAALAVAESLATRYPTDPRAFEILGKTRFARGDWTGAVAAAERAIALDSAAEDVENPDCRVCLDLSQLAETYLWWDSLPAAERTARRMLRLRPGSHQPWQILARIDAAHGDAAGMRANLRRFVDARSSPTVPTFLLRYWTLVEDFVEAERQSLAIMGSSRREDVVEARWHRTIALQYQGRLQEALELSRVRPSPIEIAEAMIQIERGNARAAVDIFARPARGDESRWPAGTQARHRAWNNTLLGMALFAAGDTAAVRRLADTVEYWGARSGFGRDRRAHHYLRGMLLVAQGRDADASVELRQAIHSPSHGFTRVNYELGRVLLREGRPAEAASVIRAALHGDVDGSNLYVTRTDLHELLAQAFDAAGMPDSAAVHYRRVVRAWERADAPFHERRERARAWLAARSTVASPAGR